MTLKVVRGSVIAFRADPRNHGGSSVSPAEMKVHVNYRHADRTTFTDPPIDMARQSDGTWLGLWDTAVADDGPAFASIRSVHPGASLDNAIFRVACS